MQLLLLTFAFPVHAQLNSTITCQGASFFECFDFFTANDPTHGYVDYVSQGEAASAGLISTNSSVVRIGTDVTNVASGRGRKSVRLTSKKAYDSGLVLIDLTHMPTGCGTW
jgi:hypothetical protein